MRVQWTRDWIMMRTLFGQYENLLAELNREGPKRYRNFLRVDNDLFEQLLYRKFLHIYHEENYKLEASYCPVTITCLLYTSDAADE